MTRYAQRTLIQQPTLSNWGQTASGDVPYGTATGGSSSSITVSGVNYTLLKFLTDSSLVVTKTGLFDIYMCGGGGGGGGESTTANYGGGGAGGVVTATIYLTAATYTVDVGAGGAAKLFGLDSTIGSTTVGSTVAPTAVGGGGGGMAYYTVNNAISRGGSGAGLYQEMSQANTNNVVGQGYAGGSGSGPNTTTAGAGGGGGAAGVGQNGNYPGGPGGATGFGGNGGAGISELFFTGTNTFHHGGGGGRCSGATSGAGGNGGGGAATSGASAGTAGSTNDGAGGGAGYTGGAGGAGFVYVRFKV